MEVQSDSFDEGWIKWNMHGNDEHIGDSRRETPSFVQQQTCRISGERDDVHIQIQAELTSALAMERSSLPD